MIAFFLNHGTKNALKFDNCNFEMEKCRIQTKQSILHNYAQLCDGNTKGARGLVGKLVSGSNARLCSGVPFSDPN